MAGYETGSMENANPVDNVCKIPPTRELILKLNWDVILAELGDGYKLLRTTPYHDDNTVYHVIVTPVVLDDGDHMVVPVIEDPTLEHGDVMIVWPDGMRLTSNITDEILRGVNVYAPNHDDDS